MADNYEIDVTIDEIFGTGISSVEQTVESHEPNGVNEVTVTLTNGQTSVFKVRNGDSSGKPTPVSLVSEMTNPAEIYLYTGSEEGYVKGDIYCYKDNAWTDVGAYGGMLVDDELDADSENAVTNKAITEAINEVKADTNALIAAVGSPMVASTVSAMTDHTKIYVYTGSETSYTYGHWYYWNGAYWEDGGVYQSDGLNTDKTLTVPNQAADAQKTGQEISDLKSALANVSMKDAIKQALLNLADAVGYEDEETGQSVRTALYNALYDNELLSITATFVQGSAVIYDTDTLDTLKQYLTVTAHYDDGTSGTVTSYTLSGTLTVGTSTITVSYAGKTTTFTVTVTEATLPSGYTEIDYVWTQGNSVSTPIYVNTGVIPTSGTSFEYRVSRDQMPTSSPASNQAGQVCANTNAFIAPLIRYQNNAVQLMFCRAQSGGAIDVPLSQISTTISADTPFDVKAYRNGTNDVYLNDVKAGEFAFGSTEQVTQLELFNYGTSNFTAQHCFVGKLYYMRIYENDTMIRNYIPCRNPSNVVGLYDKVNQNFITSATSKALSAPSGQ